MAYDPDEFMRARGARRSPKEKKYKDSQETFLKDLQGGKSAVRERITVDDLDVLMLRNVPSDDYLKRPWAATTAAEFGRVAMRHGVIVVNDPNGLSEGVDQDVLPALSRGGSAANDDHPRPRRDQAPSPRTRRAAAC